MNCNGLLFIQSNLMCPERFLLQNKQLTVQCKYIFRIPFFGIYHDKATHALLLLIICMGGFFVPMKRLMATYRYACRNSLITSRSSHCSLTTNPHPRGNGKNHVNKNSCFMRLFSNHKKIFLRALKKITVFLR